MKIRLPQIFGLMLGLILCGALLAEIFLYSQNTLVANGHWRATKRELQMSLMGADEFLVTRSTLAGNLLNLGAWHGYQDVRLKMAPDAEEVKFSFRIPENSYLDILLDKRDGNYSGIRLSRSSSYRSVYFLSDRDGRFLSVAPLQDLEIGANWHQGLITRAKGAFSFQIDNGSPAKLAPNATGPLAIGFRAGLTGALIDDVVVRYSNGTTFVDSFRNEQGWLKFAAFFSLCLAMVLGIIIFSLVKLGRWPEALILNGSIVAVAQVAVCLSIYHAFDFYYWSKLPFQTDMRLLSTGEPVPQMPFEEYRTKVFKAWHRLLSNERYPQQEVLEQYRSDRIFRGPIFCGAEAKACTQTLAYATPSREKTCLRLVLIGTSQSVGAGAADLEQSFFVRLHRGLSKNLKDRCLESLNLSISASNLEELTTVFNEQIGFHPDIVLANFSNNDPALGYYERLGRLVEMNRKIQAQTVFLLEANSADAGYSFGLKDKHETMRKAGLDFGAEVFPMQDYLANKELMQSGPIWWDVVHLSAYGHVLVAEWLQPKLLALIAQKHGVR